ncbi:hypothetical protein GGR54DRAFT_341534 [Hypoxylon sp. NC1633]|nr:hypothetical protein GGR54DRAFT_341534 [Hypoxylon sp. NC1633]
MVCFLADKAALKEMVLSRSELWVILSITAGRFMREGYQHHRLIPVTIVSSSGRQLRITQGCVDGMANHVTVRMTQILDFTAGEVAKRDDLLRTLCWIVGEPIGITT